jgi:hypothetical protein
MKQVIFKDAKGKAIFTFPTNTGGFALSVERAFTAFFKDSEIAGSVGEKSEMVHSVEVSRT